MVLLLLALCVAVWCCGLDLQSEFFSRFVLLFLRDIKSNNGLKALDCI